MRNSGNSHVRSLTAAVLAGIVALGFASLAVAAPPSRGGILGWASSDTSRPNLPNRSSGGRPDLGRLDLRAPTDLPSYTKPADAASAPIPFPARRTAINLHDEERTLGPDEPQLKVSGGMQEFARRFHREGLPVARLWEGHSALVSLGLNQRGKPGLWLIQKTK
jgi:hypothetical protein